MRRYVAAIFLAVLSLGLATPGAHAEIGAPGPVISTPGAARPVPPCVTTTWRSHYWGLPKTRVGERCYATPDMWVSKYWPKVGAVVVRGHVRPVYLRTV